MSKFLSALEEADRERRLREEAQAAAGSAPTEPGRPPSAVPLRRRLLGGLLIRDGLLTKPQLDVALRTQQRLEGYTPIGQVLVDQGVITQEQLDAVLAKYNKNYRLGDILLEANAITEEQLEVALHHQKKVGLRLGDLLLRLNLVTEERMREALSKQLRVPLVDLDQVVIDGSVAHLLNRRYAQQRRIIPIARAGNRITLAMDDPTDVGAIEELESSTGCRIEVVISTSAAFDRAFRRAYDAVPEADEARAPREVGPEAGTSAATTHEGPGLSAESRRALAELTAARDALRGELEATARALAELREQYAALLRDRQDVADRLEAVLRRLKA